MRVCVLPQSDVVELVQLFQSSCKGAQVLDLSAVQAACGAHTGTQPMIQNRRVVGTRVGPVFDVAAVVKGKRLRAAVAMCMINALAAVCGGREAGRGAVRWAGQGVWPQGAKCGGPHLMYSLVRAL